MKIAMIGHKRIPSREGGVEIVVEELSTRMVKLGHSVTAYNRKGKNVADKNADLELHKLKEYKGVRIVNVITSEKKSLNAMIYSVFATLRATFKRYNVIHFHAEGPCVMLIIPHLLGIRTVATIHGLDWQRAKWGGFASKYLKLGERIAAKYADEVIVLSKNVQEYFLDRYGRETHYIPNGVNEPEIKTADIITQKYGLTKDSYFLFLARIVPEKGLHYLLEAFSRVETDKKLVVAGGASHTGEYVEHIREIVANDPRVIMTGFVQGQELEELYSNAYSYVLPSDLEGMPLSLLEAMSYRNCCVTSDIPECVEVVGDRGITFPKGNVKELTAIIKKMCEDTQWVQYYKDNSADIILKKYNWDSVVEKTLELYKKKEKMQ